MESKEQLEERELLKRIAAGDEIAFTMLFNTWYPLLSTHVFRITRSLPETEEIVQDVFFKIWISREALLSIDNFRPYLWVMARHQALNALKKTAREREKQQHYLRDVPPSEIDQPDPQHIYHSLIDEAIGQLPPQQQKVFMLSRQSRMKQAEIASEMGITVSTVKKYVQLANESISRYIMERYQIYLPPILLILFFY